jgi:hypothetical protein
MFHEDQLALSDLKKLGTLNIKVAKWDPGKNLNFEKED